MSLLGSLYLWGCSRGPHRACITLICIIDGVCAWRHEREKEKCDGVGRAVDEIIPSADGTCEVCPSLRASTAFLFSTVRMCTCVCVFCKLDRLCFIDFVLGQQHHVTLCYRAYSPKSVVRFFLWSLTDDGWKRIPLSVISSSGFFHITTECYCALALGNYRKLVFTSISVQCRYFKVHLNL